MSWLAKIFGVKVRKVCPDNLNRLIFASLDDSMKYLEEAAKGAAARAARYDGMGRLTHTQEILRAQAVVQAECYGKVSSAAFKLHLAGEVAKAIVQ